MRASELPGELVDRGIYWQIGGFAVVALSSAVLLVEFAGSDYRAFLYFEVAATKLYWAFVIPLAGLFDGVRKMFEKMSEIRAKRRQRWLDEGRHEGRQEGRREGRQEGRREGRQEGRREGRQEGRRQERERVRAEVQRLGAALSPEIVASLLDDPDDPSEQRDAQNV